MYSFKTMEKVRELPENWTREYNQKRPHDPFGGLILWEYPAMHKTPGTSNLDYFDYQGGGQVDYT